jgi:hypothetical protein
MLIHDFTPLEVIVVEVDDTSRFSPAGVGMSFGSGFVGSEYLLRSGSYHFLLICDLAIGAMLILLHVLHPFHPARTFSRQFLRGELKHSLTS